MKLKSLALALLLALPGLSQETAKWTKTEITLEITYQTLLLIDWRQTSDFHKYRKVDADGTEHTVSERNWLLGSHPKQSAINIACLLSAVGHFAMSQIMGHDRKYWQYATVAVELFAVGNNYNVGVRITW